MPRPNRNTDVWLALAVSVGAAAVACGVYYGMTQLGAVEAIHHLLWRMPFSPWTVTYLLLLGPWFAAVAAAAVRYSRSRPRWWRVAPLMAWCIPWSLWTDLAARLGAQLHLALVKIGVEIPSASDPLVASHDVHVAIGVVISGFVTAALTWWATGSRLVLITMLAVAPLGAALFRIPGSDYAALATWWVAAVASLVMWARTRRLQPHDQRCAGCGYDLRGLPRNQSGEVPCPECGRADRAKAD